MIYEGSLIFNIILKPNSLHFSTYKYNLSAYIGVGWKFVVSSNIIRFIFNQIDTLCSKVQLYFKTDHHHERKRIPAGLHLCN